MGLLATLVAVPADARRGGSFGSRGARTYSAPRSTSLAPGYTTPVARSMTARPAGPAYAPSAAYPQSAYPASGYPASRPRFGFGGGLLTGLVAGGLVGSLFGHHMGGGYGGYGGGVGGGMLASLIQIALLAGLVWLAFRLFRGRGATQPSYRPDAQYQAAPAAGPMSYAAPPAAPTDTDIPLTEADQAAFERLLIELQDSFGHEDYARLRAITTPEVMSYLAEELSDNATHGRRNEVSATRLLDADVSEAWREDAADYATIAMRYESVDVMRDRGTGAVISGEASRPTQATELWTFVRPLGAGSAWKVSAIQET